MTKETRYKFKVDKCAEFSCPLFHAGHMGSEICQADPNRRSLIGNNGKPPEWCPLRTSPVVIRMR